MSRGRILRVVRIMEGHVRHLLSLAVNRHKLITSLLHVAGPVLPQTPLHQGKGRALAFQAATALLELHDWRHIQLLIKHLQ